MLYKQPSEKQVLLRHGQCLQTALPAEFTVCAWNCLKCKRTGWTEEFTRLAQEADLFLTQELRLTPTARQALDQTPLQWNTAVSFFSLRKSYPTGVATGCTAPAASTAFKIGAREPLLHIPKMLLAATYPLATGKQLLVINVHAINFTGLKPFEHNLAQVQELLSHFDGPVLLGGDFNVWNERRKRTLVNTVQSAGLTELLFNPDERSRCLGRPVDFIFVRGLTPVWTKTRPTYASDHHPLLARLQA